KTPQKCKPKSNHVFHIQVPKVCRDHSLELLPQRVPQPHFVHLRWKFGVIFLF
ncbi:hypothetical protein N310_13132, partial [Acanthisitta chloris]